MPKVTSVTNNTFCWAELCSSDWSAAKTFYTELFNWQFDDQPIGDDYYYTMLQKDKDDIAAMYQMMQEQVDAQVQSHWLAYIAVENVDVLAVEAQSLGAHIIHGPHDVPGAGRMVMMSDPTGALVALWQAKEHSGYQRKLEFNVPYWHELASKDVAASTSFYTQLLGWEAEIMPMGESQYTLFSVNSEPVAGLMEMTSEWDESITPHWMIYFSVRSCDAMVAQAEQLAGTVCVPPTDIVQVGRFAVLSDPSGAVFSILESTSGDIIDSEQ
ncbi:VOC family protein [Pseudoalteromonas sp. MMG005]|uniref:VOC family protein n=1 Tax=Pseudoalteromonas sp. MMG005 TaxID=2822682 RepID=UPI001B39FA81|nr:VOC family protein [Pseudoalteromonas sp. MMG005]MBQ4846647.1 VOC family protein [Pseudoalteromonas sp. MMG005]